MTVTPETEGEMGSDNQKRDFDAAFEAYKTAADGLTYEEVDEAERRTRLARWRLGPYLVGIDASKMDASSTQHFEGVRSLLHFGRKWVVVDFRDCKSRSI